MFGGQRTFNHLYKIANLHKNCLMGIIFTAFTLYPQKRLNRYSGGFRGGPSRLRPPPLSDGLTTLLTAMLQRSLDPLAGLRGPILLRGGEGGGKGEKKGEEGNGRDRPPFRKFLDPPLTSIHLPYYIIIHHV